MADYVFMWIPTALAFPLIALLGACVVWAWNKATGKDDQ